MGKIIINDECYRTRYGRVVVYTAGSCPGNGTVDARAGIGIWFGWRHSKNVSEPLNYNLPATNAVAELEAARRAVEIAIEQNITRLDLFTRSRYVEGCVELWRDKWESNGWVNSRNLPVKNSSVIQDLYRLIDIKKVDVDIVCTPGSSNVGSRSAIELSREGADDN